jgi:hypothetical protein
MGVVALVLLVCAVALVLGAEWPTLARRLAARAPQRRRRPRARGALRLVEEEGDRDDFERSVARDLENLPVLGEPDDGSRR